MASIIEQAPTSAVQEAWLPGLGSNFTLVADEDPDTFVSSLSPGDLDRYAFASLPSSVLAVNSFIVNWRALCVGADATARVNVRLGASVTNGATRPLTVNLTWYSEALTRPGGGSWTKADVDAATVELELVTAGFSVSRVTRLYRQVSVELATAGTIQSNPVRVSLNRSPEPLVDLRPPDPGVELRRAPRPAVPVTRGGVDLPLDRTIPVRVDLTGDP